MRKLTTEEWVEKAKAMHGDRYDYSRVEYLGGKKKVTIGCRVEGHGWFDQTAAVHANMGCGCKKCRAYEMRTAQLLTTEEWIESARAMHGDRYDYSKTKYVDAKIDLTIICSEHGEFSQLPGNHTKGKGCLDCSGKKRLTTGEWIINAREVHGDAYDYSKVEYINAFTSVIITCPKHGEFPQTPTNHSRGKGCASCMESGFKPNKPATLYLLLVETRNQLLYKVGITNLSVAERFSNSDLELITILHELHYESGQDAFDAEQAILKATKDHAYTGSDILRSGNSELRTCDLTRYIKDVHA